MTDPAFTPEQLAEATQPQRDDAGPLAGPVIPPELPAAARTAGAAPAEVDVSALLGRIQALEAQMAAGASGGGEHPLVGTAKAALDLLRVHFSHNPAADGGPVLRLAEDVADAAANAVASGDVSVVRELGGRLQRAVQAAHPGPGQHHYFRQALDMIEAHLPRAADQVTGPAPVPAAALAPAGAASGGTRPPRPAVAGSVTG